MTPLIAALAIALEIVLLLMICVLAANALLQSILLAMAVITIRTRPPDRLSSFVWRQRAAAAPSLSILAPAYNEEATVVQSVKALLASRYPEFEVIVINDGSRDATLERLIDAFELRASPGALQGQLPHQTVRTVYCSPLHANLAVLDKENGGKADALNAGTNHAKNALICSIDADSILEEDALIRAVGPFIDEPEKVVAVGGTVRVANGCEIRDGAVHKVGLPRNIWALIQTIEYLRAFLMARVGWCRLGAVTVISGAFGVFRRDSVLEVGGYDHTTVGEDMELVVRLHRHNRELRRPYAVRFLADPICWTEAPESLAVLARQRARWQRGALETFWRHRGMVAQVRYGAPGLLGVGSIALVDIATPIAELLGYLTLPLLWAFDAVSLNYCLAFFALSVVFGFAISIAALLFDEIGMKRLRAWPDLLRLAGAALVENLGYRQATLYWRCKGIIQWLFRRQTEWGAMPRRGF